MLMFLIFPDRLRKQIRSRRQWIKGTLLPFKSYDKGGRLTFTKDSPTTLIFTKNGETSSSVSISHLSTSRLEGSSCHRFYMHIRDIHTEATVMRFLLGDHLPKYQLRSIPLHISGNWWFLWYNIWYSLKFYFVI